MKKYLFITVPVVSIFIVALADTFVQSSLYINPNGTSTLTFTKEDGTPISMFTTNAAGELSLTNFLDNVVLDFDSGLTLRTSSMKWSLGINGNAFFNGQVTATNGFSGPANALRYITNTAPTGVTVGTTAPDRWILIYDIDSRTFYVPAWTNH